MDPRSQTENDKFAEFSSAQFDNEVLYFCKNLM